jgi:hypothetical protein
VVEGWPCRFQSAAAAHHGIDADSSFDDIIDTFLREQPKP